MKTKPLLAALALAAATSAAADAPDLTGSMELLCNPNKSRWPSTSANDARSRSMTAIVPYRGKFYVSGGCWDPNTGAAPIYAVDPESGSFVLEYMAGTERFDYFREASTGHLYAPVTDQHEDGPNWGALFRRDPDGTWRCFKDIIPRGDFPAGTFGNIDNQGFAIHTWDLCCWKGSVFTAGYGIAYGPEGSDGTMANATPGLGTAYRQFKASDSSYTSYYRRFYAFLPFEDDLFCTTLNYSPASAPEINAFEEWRFDAAAGVFRCEERPWSEFAPGVTAQDRAAVSGTYVAPANTTPFKGRVLYLLGPSSVDSPKPWCLFSAANVDHHVKATKVDLGGATPFCICRHVTRHGDEVVDVLAAQFDPSDRTVVNSVWESSDGVSFEKLFTFRTAQQASALARAGDCFYAGIGWRFTTTWNLACRDGSSGNAGDDASGDIYRIPFRPVYRPLDLARAVGTPKEKGAKARVAVTVSCLEAPSASLSLAVDGATVASWPSVAEGETCSAVVPTEPGSSHSFVFTGRPEGYDPVTADGSFVATPDDGWFRVDLDDPGYEAGTGWTDTGYVPNPDGAWTVSGFSSLSADPAAPTRRVEVDGPGAAVFAAERASAAGADAVVTGLVCVAAYDAPPDLSAVAPAASLSFVRGAGGAIAPYGYDGAAWHRLDPPAAGLAAGRWTRYAAEFDLSSAEAPRVRFRLDGELLLAAGAAWLPLAAAPQGLSEVVFTGSGSFGSFAGATGEGVLDGGGDDGGPKLSDFLDRGYAIASDANGRGAVVFKATESGDAEVVWRWRCGDDPNFQGANAIVYTSDVKVRDGGRTLLVVGATDWAVVDGDSGVCQRSGSCGDNGHGIDLLPDGCLVKADYSSQTEGALRLIAPNGAVKTVASVPFCHGVEWDEARGCLWAVGFSNLYRYSYDSASQTLSLVSTHALGANGGHMLELCPEDGCVYLTDWSNVKRFDPATGSMTTLYSLSNSKSVSHSDELGDLVEMPTESNGYHARRIRRYPLSGTASYADVSPQGVTAMYRAKWLRSVPARYGPVLPVAGRPEVAFSRDCTTATFTLPVRVLGTPSATLSLAIDGSSAGSAAVSGTGAASVSATVEPGATLSYVLTLVDANGNRAIGRGTAVVPYPPELALGEPTHEVADGNRSATVSVPLSGVGAGGVSATLSVNGAVVRTWTGLEAPTVLSHAFATEPDAVYEYLFAATDAAGATVSRGGSFAADRREPSIDWSAVEAACENVAWIDSHGGVSVSNRFDYVSCKVVVTNGENRATPTSWLKTVLLEIAPDACWRALGAVSAPSPGTVLGIRVRGGGALVTEKALEANANAPLRIGVEPGASWNHLGGGLVRPSNADSVLDLGGSLVATNGFLLGNGNALRIVQRSGSEVVLGAGAVGLSGASGSLGWTAEGGTVRVVAGGDAEIGAGVLAVSGGRTLALDVAEDAVLRLTNGVAYGTGASLAKSGAGALAIGPAPGAVALAAGALRLAVPDTSYDLSACSAAGGALEIGAFGVRIDSAPDALLAGATFALAPGLFGAGDTVLASADPALLARAAADIGAALPTGLRCLVSGDRAVLAAGEAPVPELGRATAAVAADGASAVLSVPVLSVGSGGLALTLSLDGAVVETWTGVGAPATFEKTVETVPGSSHSFSFAAVDALGASATASGVFTAAVLDGWFDVRFSDPGYEEGTNWWSDVSRVTEPGGSWTAADAASALVGVAGSAPRHVELNATEGVAYVATAPSRDGADVAVRGRVRVCAEGAPPAAPAAGDLGGLAFVGGEGGAIVPWGFAAGGGWFAFDAPAAPLEHGAWYDWEVDLDLSSDAAPAIRYRLGGAALLRAGAEWLPLPGGVAHATGVVFRGDGAIGDFKGVYAGGRIVGEPVVPAFGGGSPLAFGTDPGTGGPTFSMTVVNAVEGCYYTVFAASALDDDFVAEKDGEPAPADGTLVLTAPAGAPARFFRIVVSTFPIEAGTLFSSLPLSP